MEVDQQELKLVEDDLWPSETVMGTVKQRRILPGGSLITPTTVFITNKRIIIMNRASAGLRKDFEIIPYNKITSVRLEHGIISSSVFVRVEGYDKDVGLLSHGKEEGEIDGLKNRDAQELVRMLNENIASATGGSPVDNLLREPEGGVQMFCSKCGAKNPSDAKFCSKCGSQLVTGQ